MTTVDPAKTSHQDNPTSYVIRWRGRIKRATKRLTGAHSWRWAIGATILFLVIAMLSVVFAAIVTPDVSINTLGQHFTLRSVTPDWSLSGHGKITVNTGEPQTFDLLPTRYYGPVRIHLSVDAPFQGSDLLNKAAINHTLPPEVSAAFTAGIRTWLLWFLGFALLAGILLASTAASVLLFIKKDNRKQAGGLMARSLATTALGIALVSALFLSGSISIRNARSLDELVGHSASSGLHPQAPRASGPDIKNYDAVSIGDSRSATQGGEPLKNPSKEDSDCRRSSDSLAGQIGRIENWRVLNLSCSSATIANGLMGEQSRGGRSLLAQVSVVKKMTGIKAVFVTIGPNDLWWSRAIGLCYVADVCNDNLTTPDYQALLEKFKWDYHGLLVQLQELTNGPDGSHPVIVINGSYDVLRPGDTCSATKGLTPDKINMLVSRNADLNKALQDGASLFGFKFVIPHLKTLCDDLSDTPGAEIRPPTDPNAFHPTDIGVLVMATADALALAA